MKAMELIAHGSRRQASNEEVVLLYEKLNINNYNILVQEYCREYNTSLN